MPDSWHVEDAARTAIAAAQAHAFGADVQKLMLPSLVTFRSGVSLSLAETIAGAEAVAVYPRFPHEPRTAHHTTMASHVKCGLLCGPLRAGKSSAASQVPSNFPASRRPQKKPSARQGAGPDTGARRTAA